MDAVREKIIVLLEPFLGSQGFDLIDTRINHGHTDSLIQIFVDKPQGGITMDECARLHSKIRELFDQEKILDGNYALEVSSPGIDRPLSSVKDFLRSCGKEIIFYLKEPIEGRRAYQGIVERVQHEHVFIKHAGKEVGIPIQSINKAKQMI